MRAALLICSMMSLAAGAGCAPDEATDGAQDAGAQDAGAQDAGAQDAGAQDAGAQDAGAQDAGAQDAGAPDAGARWTRFELLSGEVVEGERVATYDHARWWWHPAPVVTTAVFDPRALRPWPDDRSLRFLRSSEIARQQVVPPPDGALSYVAAMRMSHVELQRVPLDGVAYVITGGERYHLEESGYGDFAWDLVRHDSAGRRFVRDGAMNEDYFVFDDPVFLPTGGVVVEVVDDAPDRIPGPADLNATNNLVGVQVYGGFYIYLLHLRQGSVPPSVTVGARLDAGAMVGRVGNSGVSVEPHLHVVVHAADPDSDPSRLWSVPAEWTDVYAGTGRRPRLRDFVVPTSGMYLSNDPF